MKTISDNNTIIQSRIKLYSDRLREEFRKKKELRNQESIERWKEIRDRLSKW